MIQLKQFQRPHSSGSLRISFCDENPEVSAAIAASFVGTADVEVMVGDMLVLSLDAVVSPANSFGDMSGGIDKSIDDASDGEAQSKIVTRIRSDFLGELPVGHAIIEPVAKCNFRYVIAAPTMRTPTNVNGTINAYLAMRAVLVAVAKHNQFSSQPITTIGVPGLCTGVGGMPYSDAASQIRTAYQNVLESGWERVVHPAMAPYPVGQSIAR